MKIVVTLQGVTTGEVDYTPDVNVQQNAGGLAVIGGPASAIKEPIIGDAVTLTSNDPPTPPPPA